MVQHPSERPNFQQTCRHCIMTMHFPTQHFHYSNAQTITSVLKHLLYFQISIFTISKLKSVKNPVLNNFNQQIQSNMMIALTPLVYATVKPHRGI